MTNFLYILGAGASANVLPIINSYTDNKGNMRRGLMDELLIFTGYLKEFDDYISFYTLCNEAKQFTTPDTYAKYLYVTGRENDYLKFKTIISAYFFWQERVYSREDNCLDKRVVSFLTTIAKKNGHFPENIKIINWNYDTQFIKAINIYEGLGEGNKFLENYKSFPFAADDTIDKMNLHLVHLNGVAGYTFNEKLKKNLNKGNQKDMDSLTTVDVKVEKGKEENYRIKKIFDIFLDPNDSLLISFAWETDWKSRIDYPYANQRLEYARALARAADILIVIGYSFPFFNRDIDKMIFSEMPTLRKIYFQDPVLTGDFLYNQFSLLKSQVLIEHISDVRNYYVPYEL